MNITAGHHSGTVFSTNLCYLFSTVFMVHYGFLSVYTTFTPLLKSFLTPNIGFVSFVIVYYSVKYAFINEEILNFIKTSVISGTSTVCVLGKWAVSFTEHLVYFFSLSYSTYGNTLVTLPTYKYFSCNISFCAGKLMCIKCLLKNVYKNCFCTKSVT